MNYQHHQQMNCQHHWEFDCSSGYSGYRCRDCAKWADLNAVLDQAEQNNKSTMQIIPTQNYILVRIHDAAAPVSGLVLPEGSSERQPYGEVIAVGPDCKLCTPGESVLFLPGNLLAGFDQGNDAKFILPEGAVFAKLILKD